MTPLRKRMLDAMVLRGFALLLLNASCVAKNNVVPDGEDQTIAQRFSSTLLMEILS